MRSIDILSRLPMLFRYADLLKFTGNANVFLTRALNQGLIKRLTRGVYINAKLKGEPSLEEAAGFVRSPSYISGEWALNRHGVILQVPTVCTVITLSTAVGASRNLFFQGITIEYSHISSRLYFGFKPGDGFNLATPEKALLDCIYFRQNIPFEGELDLEALDGDLLQEMAGPFPLRVRKSLKTLSK